MELVETIENKIQNMRITNIVQTGHIRIPLTEMLTKYGKVFFLTASNFNPFETNDKVVHVTKNISNYPYNFKKKYGILDICIFGHIKHFINIREELCAWTPSIRKNGFMIFLDSSDIDSQNIIKNYIDNIDPNYFDIKIVNNITFVKVL